MQMKTIDHHQPTDKQPGPEQWPTDNNPQIFMYDYDA